MIFDLEQEFKENKIWHLEQFSLFETLNAAELRQLSQITTMKTLNAGQIIHLPFDRNNAIYFLKSGKVKISKYSEGGKELIKSIMRKGEIFGELALAGIEDRDEIIEVLENSLICSIEEPHFRAFIEDKPALNFKITKLIGLRLRKIENRLSSLYFKNAEERVRDFIRELAEKYGKKIGLGFETEIRFKLTHDEIAKLTANSRQNVTTILRNLEKQGIISYDRRRILIRDIEKL